MIVTPLSAVLAACGLLALGLMIGRVTARFGPHLGASLKRQRFNGVTVYDGSIIGRAGRRSRSELSVYFVLKRAPRDVSIEADLTRDAVATR